MAKQAWCCAARRLKLSDAVRDGGIDFDVQGHLCSFPKEAWILQASEVDQHSSEQCN